MPSPSQLLDLLRLAVEERTQLALENIWPLARDLPVHLGGLPGMAQVSTPVAPGEAVRDPRDPQLPRPGGYRTR